MKNIIFPLFIVLFVASCSSDGYKIKGSFPSAPEGTVVYLLNPNNELAVEDSAVVDGGKFEFAGGFHERSVRMLLAESAVAGGPVVLEPGIVYVKVDGGVVRGGTDGNEILQRFLAAYERVEQLESVTSPAFLKTMPIGEAMLDSLVAARDTARNSLVEYSLLAIEQNIDNGLGFYILTRMYDRFETARLVEILSRLPLYLRNSRYDVMKQHANQRSSAAWRRIATAVGREYQNFELPAVGGEQVLFSDIVTKNRYTLLQFWASWCAPCRAELPHLEKLHAKYRKQRVAFVGLSLDSNLAECTTAVEALGLSWLQLCDPTGGSSEVAAAYGVDAIPANVLINDKGVILGRDLSPAELEAILGESIR